MPEDTTILRQIFDQANRANPYPLWATLRDNPVCWQEDGPDDHGNWVVSTYYDIEALLHDPRFSTDIRHSAQVGEHATTSTAPLTFTDLDPPEHDRLRRLTMRHFGPPERPEYLEQLRPRIADIVTGLLDRMQGQQRIDFVDQFAYRLPVAVICMIMGIPAEDEPKFHVWSSAIAERLAGAGEEQRRQREQAISDLTRYFAELIQRHRERPGDDLLSRMATDTGPDAPLPDETLVATASLLFFGGHETTVNLLANGFLTLLRNPAAFDRLRDEPGLIPTAVEEMLRYEPPVQFLPNRTTIEDIQVSGTTIPAGALVTLAIAAGNRDPARFPDADRFDPARRDNQHLGFGSGIHSCFGAPLARIEAHVAFAELVRRLERPRLVVDPPPYRPSPFLRGPEQLLIDFDGVRASHTLPRRPQAAVRASR